MNGQVKVTSLINLVTADVSGTLNLSWSGGGGIYQALRSSDPRFPTGTATVILTPPGGTTTTSLTDLAIPAVGQANFYLVMNQF